LKGFEEDKKKSLEKLKDKGKQSNKKERRIKKKLVMYVLLYRMLRNNHLLAFELDRE